MSAAASGQWRRLPTEAQSAWPAKSNSCTWSLRFENRRSGSTPSRPGTAACEDGSILLGPHDGRGLTIAVVIFRLGNHPQLFRFQRPVRREDAAAVRERPVVRFPILGV